MNKKLMSLTLSSAIILNATSQITSVYAAEKTDLNQAKDNQNKNGKNIVYLKGGEGSQGAGNGSKENPYQNVRTALENIANGGTLKLVGSVTYTTFDVDTDKATLPLYINKNITIEGASGKSPLASDADEFILRSPIQLGANVTFKNINLQLVPQVTLGKSSKLLGEVIPRSATIFAAGHELTLDNVNTKVGTSPEQDTQRPYISGGSFRNKNNFGSKSIINVINPNSQTQFSGIYAGDYTEERNLDVEINFDGKVLDNKIYTGGITKPLNGTVNINLGPKSNVHSFDKTNHEGNVNVKLKENTYIEDIDFNNVNDLTLEENAKAILKDNTTFNVNNVTLKNGSIIDFRKASSNPTAKGNFQGVDENSANSACILLKDTQNLNITGYVLGTTNLNDAGTIYREPLDDGHKYIIAKENSSGNFTSNSDLYNNFTLEKKQENNQTTWTAVRSKNTFKDFNWGYASDKIINNQEIQDDLFPIQPIEFINANDKQYIPDGEEWNEFEFKLTKADGTELIDNPEQFDTDLSFTMNPITGVIELQILNPEYTGEITLTATHKNTKKSISKKMYIVNNNDSHKLTGNVSISGDAVEGNTITANTSNLPGDVENIRYSWYVNDIKIDGKTSKDFVLTKEYVNKKVKVEVEAQNYVGSILSSEVLVEEAEPIIPEPETPPTTPEEPENPGNPVVPPTQPEKPEEPQKPVVPPTTPETPEEPQKPVVPPTKPEEPEQKPSVVETVKPENLFNGLTLTNEGKKLVDALENGVEVNGKVFEVKQSTDHKISKLSNGMYELVMDFIGTNKPSTYKTTNKTFRFQIKVTAQTKEELQNIAKMFTLTEDGKVEGPSVNTIIGPRRTETAVKISKENFKPVSKNGSVVLVGSSAVVDGLSAGPLAKLVNAPLLLTSANALDNNVENEIKRLLVNNTAKADLKTQTVYIVGGTSVVSENVVNKLKQLGIKVERLAGDRRDTTSLAVAKKMAQKNAKFEKAFVIGAKGEADAMSISAHAAKEQAPIIVGALNGSLSNDAKKLITNKQIDIIGGETAVNKKLEEELKSIDKDKNVTRVKGANRFETNANVIKTYYTGANHVYVAKDGQKEGNDKLVDALAISPVAATNNGVVVLATNNLTKEQQDALKSSASTAKKMTQVGGGVSETIITKIAKMLGFIK